MRVTLAYPYTDKDGKSYEPDKSIDVSDEVGAQLLRDGLAREGSSSKTTTKKEG